MKLKLLKIGTSRILKINNILIEQCHLLGNEVEATVTEKGLLISPIKVHPRKDWAEKFKAAIALGQMTEDIMPDGCRNNFDQDEWTWPEMN